MITWLRRILKLDDQDTALREFAQTLEAADVLRVEIDTLAKAYLTNSTALTQWLKDNQDADVQELIKAQQESLTGRYLKALAEKRQEYDRIENQKQSYITQHPDFAKALQALRQRDFIEKSLGQYHNQQLTLTEVDMLIKAATKDKVKYSDNIIFNQRGELLIVQRAPLNVTGANLWVLPGGHIKTDEDHETAAKRELVEETGYMVEDCYRVGEYSDDGVYIEYFTSMIDTDEQSPTLDAAETRDSQFIPVKDLYKYPTLFTNMWDNVYKILGIKQEVVKIKKAVAEGIIKDNMLVDDIIDALFKGCGGGQKEKFHKVMKKWKAGTLHSGDKEGEKVTGQEQAIAIAMSETGQSKEQKAAAVEGEFEKARVGVYENTEENRKLGRVGQHYGSMRGDEGKSGFLYTKEFYGVNFHTNQDREYDGKKVSPWDSKGSERGMTKDDMVSIAFASADGGELESEVLVKPEDSLKDICDKLRKQSISDIEIYKSGLEYRMRPVKAQKLSFDDFKRKLKITEKSQGYGKGTDFERTMWFYDAKIDGQSLGTMSSYKLTDAQVAKELYDQYVGEQPDVEKAEKDKLPGGKADKLTLEQIAKKHKVDLEDIEKEYKAGLKVEREHTDDEELTGEIARDHLTEMPDYYTRLAKMEAEKDNGGGENKRRFVRTK